MDMHENNVELFDDGLKEIMGDRYDDGETHTEMPAVEVKTEAKPKRETKKIEHMDAQYVPVAQKDRDFMERLKSCTAWGLICGGICMLMWWFWMNGLMAMEAAYPCILASAMVGTGGAVWSLK